MKKYSVKAVSTMTGITPDTLRAWERRYQAVSPQREPGGRRWYDEAAVVRLNLLKQAVDRGHAIGMVAPLPDETLKELLQTAEMQESDALEGTAAIRRHLIEAIDRYDLAEFDKRLNWTAMAVTPRQFAFEVVAPLLEEVGERWHDGRLSIAQEHAISASLRSMLGAMIRMFGRQDGRPGVTFATMSGDRHEFGLLLLCLLAAIEGVPCNYLGVDLPAEEIARAARKTKSRAVAISSVYVEDPEAGAAQLKDLAARLDKGVELWVGGGGSRQFSSRLNGLRHVVLENLVEFEQRLKLLPKN